jgi:hypothetical protein
MCGSDALLVRGSRRISSAVVRAVAEDVPRAVSSTFTFNFNFNFMFFGYFLGGLLNNNLST